MALQGPGTTTHYLVFFLLIFVDDYFSCFLYQGLNERSVGIECHPLKSFVRFDVEEEATFVGFWVVEVVSDDPIFWQYLSDDVHFFVIKKPRPLLWRRGVIFVRLERSVAFVCFLS